ncbi:uncharacterized protein LOC141630747 [Silene latifolia]|uniref:uncharacterized protein LOC141630747 n=1 Tax=Silene latifolia TaxID=37657 RepID=UPI003D788C61
MGPLPQLKPKCGLRQGDPLSPYLFILCMEVLSRSIEQVQETGLIHGLKLCRGVDQLTHLFFADDSVFFFHDKGETATHLMKLIKEYCEVSGQRLNLEKSGIVFSPNTTLARMRKVMRSVKIHKNKGIGKYLGIPAEFQESKQDIFKSLIEHVTRRISSWNGIFLSPAGRLTLISSVLSNLSNYFLSVCKVPGEQRVKDEVYWPLKKDGIYSFKSGYGLIFGDYMEKRGSQKDKNRIGDKGREFCRKKLWHLPIPSNWKILIWKILTDTLPIGAESFVRDRELSDLIWAGSELGIRTENAETVDIKDWIINRIRYFYSRKEGERSVISFVAILWGLWSIRNNVIFKDMAVNQQFLVNGLFKAVNENVQILSDHIERKDVQNNKSKGQKEQSNYSLAEIREGKPVRVIGTHGTCEAIRVKVDASWRRDYEAVVGLVAYDFTGMEILRRQLKIRAESALQAEALGVRDVLLWAQHRGCLHLDISPDCLQLINQIAGVEMENHLIRQLLANLRRLYAYYHCLSFNFIPRKLNTVEHGLAYQAMRL